MTDRDKLLLDLETCFCKKLNSKLYAFDIKNLNNYVDIVIITAVKTNKSKPVYFDSYNGKISFWNDFDEKFTRELTSQGVTEMFGVIESEIMQSCYFDIINDGRNVVTVPVKITEISDDNILEAFKEFYPYIRENFDFISVADFLGTINKKIIYDGHKSEFICVSNNN